MLNSKNIIELFIVNKVNFVIVGGLAAIVHGSTMMTQDIDMCVSFERENCNRIVTALKNINPVQRMAPDRLPLVETAATLTKYKNLYLDTDLGVIDLLGSIKGVGEYPEVLKNSIKVDFFDMQCNVLRLDALINSKLALGRPKDKETVIQLKIIKSKL